MVLVRRGGSRKTDSTIDFRPWSDLPPELLEEIMKNLSWADQIRMRSVSKRLWQLPIQDDGLFHRLPWIVARRRPYKHELVYEVHDPINTMKPYLTHKISGAKTDDSFLCKEGWMLFWTENNGTGVAEVFLFRPMAKQIVVLPDLHHGIDYNVRTGGNSYGIIRDFTFSSAPDSEGCTLFALYFDYMRDKVITSTYKQGDKEGWITKRFSGCKLRPPYTNVVYYQGGFFYASGNAVLACYRVADKKWYKLGNKEFPADITDQHWMDSSLVVTPSDELLLVCLNSLVGSCRLFTFNWTLMMWTERSHLKDQALFMGSHSGRYSFAIPALRCTAALANKIFFYSHSNYTLQFFDISEGKARDCKGTEFGFLARIIERDPTAVWVEATAVGRGHSAQLPDIVAELLKKRPRDSK